MTFTRTLIPEIILIDPKVHGDARGYFVETFRADKLFEFLGFDIPFCQENESSSSYGVLRGLHYQIPPYAQTKLIRVIEGAVLDIAVDIRKGSPTFGQHIAVELSSENKRQMLIPSGFAHGYVVLSETCTFTYKVDNYYNPECDRGIAFDDAVLGIDWKVPREKLQLSAKDTTQPSFANADHFIFEDNFYSLKGLRD
ncbi:dTDP-4-dehydrorhamnose 3,5-epimerase [Sulfuricurvum sp.]|uniref:dTDP-4-dehydrorhamnose 3,5-epimerase n=1 Tax=Sulfuricurvum sp. TaxID=2025608 RepID=UPI003BAEFAA4